MTGDDPLGSHWIRVGVVRDGTMVADAVFTRRSSVTIGSSATDTLRVQDGVFAESFCLLSEGTLVHTLPGMKFRMAHGDIVQAVTAEELGAAFRTIATRMNISVRDDLSIFVKYVPTAADAEVERRPASGDEPLLRALGSAPCTTQIGADSVSAG